MARRPRPASRSAHGSPLGADEIKGAREKLGWSDAPFEIPAEVLTQWRAAGQRSQGARTRRGSKRLAALPADKRARVRAPHARRPAGQRSTPPSRSVKEKLAAAPKEIATRTACEFALESLIPAVPEMIGGSADLTGSNNTRTKAMKALSAPDYAGRFIHYGIREHGMAAAMNGMALHGGIIPYCGTFLVFSDYCRPSIRLAALMGERVIHVMTHDSIGLGEDGPTHQPVEHLAALRAIPNLNVFRPVRRGRDRRVLAARAGSARPAERAGADAAEPAAAAQHMLDERNRCAAGAYEIVAGRRQGAGVDLRHRLGGGDRGRGAEAARRAAASRPASSRCPASSCSWQQPDDDAPRGDRRRAGQDRRRGRGPAGLGRDHRLRRRLSSA